MDSPAHEKGLVNEMIYKLQAVAPSPTARPQTLTKHLPSSKCSSIAPPHILFLALL